MAIEQKELIPVSRGNDSDVTGWFAPARPYVDARGVPRCIAGQALVEMVVGLVAMMLLLVGLLQIGRLAVAHTGAMMRARERADARARAEHYLQTTPQPLYIYDWHPGRDGVRYTQHDVPVPGLHSPIRRDVLSVARTDEIESYLGPGPLQAIEESERISDGLMMVQGRARSESVPIYPLMRRLVVRDEVLSMQHSVWMPWIRGVDE